MKELIDVIILICGGWVVLILCWGLIIALWMKWRIR